MQVGLDDFAARHLPLIETELRNRLPQSCLAGTEALNQAVSRAVFSKGKRTRPLLTLLAAHLFEAPLEPALQAGCGVEFLHTSSLILDDLPAMDDAEMRRHVPALHITFGEGTAILAALALYTKAYEIFSATPGLVEVVARAVGCDGMIGGQAADLRGIAGSRLKKTTSLMGLALRAGVYASGEGNMRVHTLERYGELVGEAYQICDDLLDVLASESLTGKTTGQDIRRGRNTLPPVSGVEAAFERARDLTEQAKGAIQEQFGSARAVAPLCEFADVMVGRVAGLVSGHDSLRCDSSTAHGGDGERRVLAARAHGSRTAGGSRVDPDTRA